MENLSQVQKKQIIELYNEFVENMQPLLYSKDKKNIEKEIYLKVRDIPKYEVMDTYSDEYILISIATNNKNGLQGIRCHIDLDEKEIPVSIGEYVDVYLCNDDYPIEWIYIRTLKDCYFLKENSFLTKTV